MKLKVLFLLCVAWSLSYSNIFAQQSADTVDHDEEIKKYEIRGVIDMEIPSISIYYEGRQLGWMIPGQKKGNCLLKTYDKKTKEVVLEIGGKEYRLKEGIRTEPEPDFEDEEVKVYSTKSGNTYILNIYSKSEIITDETIREIGRKYDTLEEITIYLHGASKMRSIRNDTGEELVSDIQSVAPKPSYYFAIKSEKSKSSWRSLAIIKSE